jgi:squalene-hopene/tetraprenyl-beta-curcumene cyclase
MLLERLACGAAVMLGLLAICAGPARTAAPGKKASPEAAPRSARTAAQRGLAFLEKDAAKWRKERRCATCHHGTMTVWALCEAKNQGYAVNAELLAETVKWTKERLATIDKPRDTRPGWSMVSTPAVLLSVMAVAIPGQSALPAAEREQIAGHLLRHQESNGSWAWSAAPPQNRPPPVMESDELVTTMASLVLRESAPAAAKEAVRASRERAAAWLSKARPAETTQLLALRLFRDVRAGRPAKELQAAITALLDRQNRDGGWGQDRGQPSDAYATGQALYFLAIGGVKSDRVEIGRGMAYLATTQKEDGSWPMKSRAHPGAKPMTNPVPITYFGSTWATLGLLRCAPR